MKKQLKEELKYQKKITREYQEAQDAAYRSYLRRLGFKVKEKWTWKRFLRLLQIIGAIILALIIMWIFPPTRNMMKETYESSAFVRAIVNVFISIFQGIGNGIGEFFKNIFKGS